VVRFFLTAGAALIAWARVLSGLLLAWTVDKSEKSFRVNTLYRKIVVTVAALSVLGVVLLPLSFLLYLVREAVQVK
jgi:hypothetical protein